MNLLRTILRPVARAAGWHARRQTRAFLAAHQRTQQVQDRLLKALLAAHAPSEFGRDHDFGRLRSYEDFAAAVPVGNYETHRPYVDRVLDGHAQAMFAPGTEVLMFAVTSGTTGSPKHIPVTRRFLAEYHRGWNIFGVCLLGDHPRGWLRKMVTIASSMAEAHSPTGVPCGSVSGMLAEHQKWIVRRMYPVPACVREIPDPAAKYYAMVRASIAHDVGVLVTANPSSLVRLGETAANHADRLIRDIREGTFTPPAPVPPEVAAGMAFRPNPRAAEWIEDLRRRRGALLPRDFWDLAFMAHWTGGTLGLYMPRVRELYGPVPVRDIGLLASEGRLSIPLADGTPGGVAEITSNVLEFIPADQADTDRPDVLRAHELEVGGEYCVVLSNWAGLFRYNINDRVRVTGTLGRSPVIEFLSRGLHTCSITGEKLTEHQVVAAMAAAARACGTDVATFVLQGHFAQPPYYELRVEPLNGVPPDALARALDEQLARLNVEYRAKRRSDRLGPVRATGVPAGSFARHENERVARRHGRGEQYKHKYLMTDLVHDGPGRAGGQ